MKLMPVKLCLRCRKQKVLRAFSKNKHGKDGLQSYCKACFACYHHEKYLRYLEENKDAIMERKRRRHEASIKKEKARAHQWEMTHRLARLNYNLKWNYNITLEDYNALFQKQKGVCAICKRPPNGKRLTVDHDHKTGRVRGLLHDWCNRALLGLVESPLGQEAVKYLKQFQ
jgi:hypothetical protein